MVVPSSDPEAPVFTRCHTNLADPRLGAEALSCSDDFFAPMQRMLSHTPPVFIPEKYDEHGKWMDGWESRRKRSAGYDWCVVKLARTGTIEGVDIDTAHFTGNFPPAASVEACYSETVPDGSTEWTEIIAPASLLGDSHHYLAVDSPRAFTHVRLNIHPDGGVARLRVYGSPRADWHGLEKGALVNLAAIENGAYAVAANDQHFGHVSNLLMPGRGENMGNGWETRRRREPGNDWCIIALAHPGVVRKVIVDTAFFKGNYPDRCSIQAALVTSGTDRSTITQAMFWKELLPSQKLERCREHFFEAEVCDLGVVSHVRLNIFPDGGVSRLRILGVISE